jgi:hypothetical protein
MTCGGMLDDEPTQQHTTNGEWLDHSQFQMSPPASRRRRRNRRDHLPNARDKSEPLVMGEMPAGEGFITEMVSTSSGSSRSGSYDSAYD